MFINLKVNNQTARDTVFNSQQQTFHIVKNGSDNSKKIILRKLVTHKLLCSKFAN